MLLTTQHSKFSPQTWHLVTLIYDGRADGWADKQTCHATCSYCQAKGLMGGCYLRRPPIVFPAGPPFPLGWACTRFYTQTHTCPHFGRTQTDTATLSETGGCLTESPDRQMMGAYPSYCHIHASRSSLFTFLIPFSPQKLPMDHQKSAVPTPPTHTQNTNKSFGF